MNYRKTHKELKTGDILYFGNKQRLWNEAITNISVNDRVIHIQCETESFEILLSISGDKSYGWVQMEDMEILATTREEVEEKLRLRHG